ncbi:MAG: WG repeat-containing protein [Aeriscardovia sp.]|nr:WG repeat-containing protein [Aeriscardovia sp.]
MGSKLKIIVDYPCEVFCDFEYKGQAEPNSIFTIELRKGRYLLEFKVNNEIYESMDYTMDSNEQEDLLRIKLLTEIEFNKVFYDKTSRTLRDNDNDSHFCGDIFVRWNIAEDKSKINYGYKKQCLTKKVPNRFNIIFEENSYDEDNTIYKVEYGIEFEPNIIPNRINVDTTWLHCHYGNYYGKFVVYMDSVIKIVYIKNSKITITKNIDSNAGFVYNIGDKTTLTIKNEKFGTYDIINNRVLCPNKYDELYRESVEYHGDIYHGFFDTDKYTVELNGKKGIVSSAGEQLLPCEYDTANPCSLGYILKKGLYWGISKNGEEPAEWYDDIFSTCQTSYGITKAPIFRENKKTIEDSIFLCGYLLYFKKDGKYGFWNILGVHSKNLYDEIETDYLFGTSLARLIKTRIGDKIGFIDCFGQEIIPCKYEEIYIARNENPSLALYCDYKFLTEYGIKTKFISDTEQAARESELYDANLPLGHLLGSHIGYHDTKFIAKVNGKYGVISVEGDKLISCEYDSVEDLGYGYFLVEKNGLYGILESDDKVIFPIKYTDSDKLKKESAYTLYY